MTSAKSKTSSTQQQKAMTALPRNNVISAVIQVVGLVFTTTSFAWLPRITNPLHKGFGSSYQFLTIIGLSLTGLTFSVGLIGILLRNERLLVIKNNVLSVCAAPLEVLIGVFYWSLYTIDKNLVVPPGHPLPFVPNLGLHAVPAIMLTLDLFASPTWTITASRVLILDSVFFLAYWAWLELCFSHNAWYPYPGLLLLSPWQKFVLCLESAGFMAASTLLLKWLHARVKKFGKDTSVVAEKTD